MPLLNLTHALAGRYAIWTEEKAICRRVARRSLGEVGRASFAANFGHEFTGSHEDRLRLSAPDRDRVDRGIVKSMRRNPRAWVSSPVVSRPIDRPETENLILNQMLDQLGSRTSTYSTFMAYCCLGTSTTPPNVADTGLGSEVVRTANTLSTYTVDDNTTRTRTFNSVFDFPAETANKNYTEVGLSYTATVGNNLGTRALLTGGTVSVLVGQQARVSYSVSVALPANTTATPTVTGDTSSFGSSAGEMVYCTLNAIAGVVSNYSLALSTGSTKPTFGTAYTPGTTAYPTSKGVRAYVVGSFKLVQYSTWNLSTGNGTSWRGLTPYEAVYNTDNSFAFVFDSAKTKDNLHTLTVDWSITFGRA